MTKVGFWSEPGWAVTLGMAGGAKDVLKSGSSPWDDEPELGDEHENRRCGGRMDENERS